MKLATCMNTFGGFTCDCAPGFYGQDSMYIEITFKVDYSGNILKPIYTVQLVTGLIAICPSPS